MDHNHLPMTHHSLARAGAASAQAQSETRATMQQQEMRSGKSEHERASQCKAMDAVILLLRPYKCSSLHLSCEPIWGRVTTDEELLQLLKGTHLSFFEESQIIYCWYCLRSAA